MDICLGHSGRLVHAGGITTEPTGRQGGLPNDFLRALPAAVGQLKRDETSGRMHRIDQAVPESVNDVGGLPRFARLRHDPPVLDVAATAPVDAVLGDPSGLRASGHTSRSGARTTLRSGSLGCGTGRPDVAMRCRFQRSTARTSVLGPHRVSRTRPRARSMASSSRKKPPGVWAVSTRATAFRNAPWSGPPTGAVSYADETARTRPTAERPRTAALR